MNVIIYESSSFGGCYRYSVELQKAYSVNPQVNKCTLLFPKNASVIKGETLNCLLNDKPQKLKKLNFILRQIINPFILLLYLHKQKAALVILNDFEQITAPLWAPLYRIFLKKHCFAIVLHDPDRDAYPPSKSISQYCMKVLMRTMHVGIYHSFLPDKPYYKLNDKVKYVNVPHGLYPPAPSDKILLSKLEDEKKGDVKIISIIGNIRPEKNYEIAIEALSKFSNIKLLIAGNPSNSSISTELLKEQVRSYDLTNRVIWIEKFLTEEEMSAAIEASDVILLNYSSSFTSQSGIINQIAPFKKQIIVSDIKSGLTNLVKKFDIGILCVPDSKVGLNEAIQRCLAKKTDIKSWNNYLNYASWENNVEQVMKELDSTLL